MTLEPSFNSANIKGYFFDRFHSLEQIPNSFTNSNNVVQVNQTHSNRCITFDGKKNIANEQADAIITSIPQQILCIRTADCTPLLIADEQQQRIGVIHAGWRGAVSGIIQNTVEAFIEQGSSVSNLKVAIGPCIQQQNYEVDNGFYQQLNDKHDNTQFFIPSIKSNHWQFDLASYCKQQLERVGIKDIQQFDSDTFSNYEYNSYRRDNQTVERQYSCIMLCQ